MQPEPSDAAYRRAGELALQMLTRIAEEAATTAAKERQSADKHEAG